MKRRNLIFSFALIIVLLGTSNSILSAEASSASFFFNTSKQKLSVGDTVTVSALLNTGGVSINAATVTITFDPSRLAVASVSKSGSALTLWAEEPSFSNKLGSISGSGGLPTPGYNGRAGSILRVTFRALATGTTTIQYAKASMLANDGQGTRVLAGLSTATLTIGAATQTPPSTPSPTEPGGNALPRPAVIGILNQTNPSAWTNDNRPTLVWQMPADADGVSVSFDHEPAGDSGTQSLGQFNFYQPKQPLSDGVWYGHVRIRNKSGWGSAGHLLINIDTTPPAFADLKILNQGNDQRALAFTVDDVTSSVAHVEVRLDGQEIATNATSPYGLPTLTSGDHVLQLTAVDEAGNSASVQTFVSIVAAAGFTSSLSALYILVIVLAVLNLALLFTVIFLEYRRRRRN